MKTATTTLFAAMALLLGSVVLAGQPAVPPGQRPAKPVTPVAQKDVTINAAKGPQQGGGQSHSGPPANGPKNVTLNGQDGNDTALRAKSNRSGTRPRTGTPAGATDGEVAAFLKTHRNVAVGDYNSDGVVDAADYVIWRARQPANGAAAGSNGGGPSKPN